MDEQYQAYLLAQIREYFYRKFDSFMIGKWSEKPFGDSIPISQREEAYNRFYQKVKNSHVANRQTIRKWFGLGELSVPSRKVIFRIAFAAKFSVKETTEYLQYGISQAGFQVNDYEEFICMYCLENGLSETQWRDMVDFFEKKSMGKLVLEQKSKTDWLWDQFDVVKEYSEEQFIVWMCRQRKYFKGYSRTVFKYYQELVEKCLALYREEVKRSLILELKKAGYYEWLGAQRAEKPLDPQDIKRYVKNRLRSKTDPLSPSYAKDIREMTTKVFASHDRLCDLVTGVYSTMPLRFQGRNKRGEMYKELEGDIRTVDFKYVSELLNIAVLKEQQMQRYIDLAQETDPAKQKKLQKEIKKNDQRIRGVQRSDLLILAQYIIYKEASESENLGDYEYDARKIKERFVRYADGILDSCGMRRIDPKYMLDYLLLSCFDEKEMYLFSELLEEYR